MKVGSLFSGIGGLDLGLERAGMEVVWQVENNEYCQRVLAKHWPDVKRYEDVRDCGASNLESVDLICGGFPCQPVSVAGQRKGDADERWLWPEFARVVGDLRPRWVLAENVPGLLSADDGRLFGGVLRDLAALGYDVEWDCIPATAVGALHIRNRVFIVAYRSSRRGGWRQRFSGGSRSAWNVADHDLPRLADVQRQRTATWSCGRGLFGANNRRPDGEWSPEPDVGRVAHGVPKRVDRLRGLGNAVVPQVAEWVGKRIMEANLKETHHV